MDDQYRSIFEATSDAMCIVNMDGFIVEANAATCQMHGYAYEELIGLHLSALTHPDDHDTIAPGMQDVAAGGSGHAYVVGLRKDGSTFYEETRGTPFTYQGRPHLLAMARDVTEQVRAYELLEQRVEERTRELSSLLAVATHVSSTLELRPLLGLILDRLNTVIDHTGAALHVVEGDWLEMLEHRFPPGTEPGPARIPVTASRFWQESLRHGEPVVFEDLLDDSPAAVVYRGILGDELEATLPFVRAYAAVPLVLKDRVIGALVISHHQPGYFTPHRRALLMALASQAAVAIENARLYERARDAAVLEERQRLSRELHDSVSQALYSIALGARTARTLLDRAPVQAAEPLDFVLSQAETGLAEMRALIFELRPEALEEDGLVAALHRQAEAVQVRHHIAVALALCDEPALSLAAKEALYRIAQEAVNNSVKHALATTIHVSLSAAGSELVLCVQDDGRGFDPAAPHPGHLGLHSMRERATRVGGTLQVESAPGAGTVVRASVPISRDL